MILYRTTPAMDDRGERRVAIPDALFKVVIREAGDGGVVEVPGFIYPQEDPAYSRKPYQHEDYLASVDSIEALTGMNLLAVLDDAE